MKKNSNNRIESLRSKRRYSIVSVCACAVLLCAAFFVGDSLGWYGINDRIAADGSTSSAPSDTGELRVGHDTYKWNLDSRPQKGVLVENDVVVMNQYDALLNEENQYTPIVLRAVLDPNVEDKAVDGKIKLTVKSECIETLKKHWSSQDIYAPDTFYHGGYTGIQNYLSNVAQLSAAYMPGLADNAEKGPAYYFKPDSDSEKYTGLADANDYIYRYCRDYFEKYENKEDTDPAKIDPVNFVRINSHTSTGNTTTTVTYIVSEADMNSLQPTASSNGSSDSGTWSQTYSIEGYLIANGTDFIGVNNNNITSYSGAAAVGTYTQSGWENNANALKCLWVGTGNDSTLVSGSTLKNKSSSRYLTGTRTGGAYSLSAVTDNPVNWTMSSSASNTVISARISNNTRYLYRGNTNWGLQYGSQNLKIYKVEKCVYSVTPVIAAKTYDNVITVDVDLAKAKSSNDNYYYVYLKIDYNKDLVWEYYNHNAGQVAFAIGSDYGLQFGDRFVISVVDTDEDGESGEEP